MARKLSDFANSPLITPARLKGNWEQALAVSPPWADAFSPAASYDGDPESSDMMMVLGVGSARKAAQSTKTSERDENGGQWMVTLSFAAILCELTRYGNSIASNSNGPAGADAALFYLKMTFSRSAKDNLPVSRLIMNAGAREEVHLTRADPLTPSVARYLHPRFLRRTGAGKPDKGAREIAIKHAKRCAENAGLTYLAEKAYVANLYALFAYHDELYGITWEFWPALAQA